MTLEGTVSFKGPGGAGEEGEGAESLSLKSRLEPK